MLRLTNVYGPRERWLQDPAGAPFNYQKVVPTFIVQALGGKPLPVFGDGEQSSEYVYVGDVVRAMLLAGTRPVAGEIIPIGTGRPVRVSELADGFWP
ncbi:MAG: NAD-dependent epimerase/dehydratase family protein [bacterium]|nr:NAD-dependent epimerase/dehydratase family protein [bacterium]